MKNDYERVATVAERMRIAMSDKGIKQVQLAAATGLSTGIISSYLSGRFEPKNTAIAKIAKALNVSPTWLCGFKVPREIPSYDKDAGVLMVPFPGKLDPARKEIISLLPDADEDTLDDVLTILRRHAERKKTSTSSLGEESLSC